MLAAVLAAAPAAAPAEAKPAAEGEAKHEAAEAHESHAFEWVADIWIPATLTGLAGILLAFAVYRLKLIDPAKVAKGLGPIYTLVYNKYYIDEIYHWLLDNLYYSISHFIAFFDRHVVDGVMNGFAAAAQAAGSVIRKAQTGRAQAYALGMLAGVVLIFGALKYLVP